MYFPELEERKKEEGKHMVTSSNISIVTACLSPMDMKIINLLAAGQEPEQIAGELHISAVSVVRHITSAERKIREVLRNV